MPSSVHIDFETRSRADLKKVGAFRYANDKSTEILCIGIAVDDEEPALWHNRQDEETYEDRCSVFDNYLAKLSDPSTLIYAHNSMFECAIADALWQKTTGFTPPSHSQWRCTAAMGRRAALPSSLKRLAEALKLGEQKDTRGQALIRKFCVPQKKTGQFIQPEDEPDAFKELCDYCLQDVRVEQAIHKKLAAFELKGFPLQTFLLDIDINCRGFPVNLDALHKADKMIDAETEKIAAEFRKLTGLEHTQNAKFLAWLKERGFEHDNLQAATLDEIFEDEEFDESTELGKALTLKKRVSYVSLKKVKSMIACAGPHDNRVRGTLLWHGAGTGRWSASLVQPTNFKRPSEHLEKYTEDIYRDLGEGCTAAWLEAFYGPPLECISSSIRHFIEDAEHESGVCHCGTDMEGHSLWDNHAPTDMLYPKQDMLDADFSAIEARIIAWQAKEKWRLDVFKTHGKIYEASAGQMFGTTMQEFSDYKKEHGKNHPHRMKGKVAELALGFRGGVNALIKMGAIKGGMKEEELQPLVDAWREASPGIVDLWKQAGIAATEAIRHPGRKYEFGIRCSFFCTKAAGMNYLFMQLPSGRKIAYPDPRLEKQIRWSTVNKETKEKVWHSILNPTVEQVAKVRAKDPKARISEAITHFGQLYKSVLWGRVTVHSGVFVENQVQGIAYDVMATAALNVEAAGYEVAVVIHDEALNYKLPGQTIEEFVSLLTTLPEWADGLPIAAEGAVVPFYRKG